MVIAFNIFSIFIGIAYSLFEITGIDNIFSMVMPVLLTMLR